MQRRFVSSNTARLSRGFAKERFGDWIDYGRVMREIQNSLIKNKNANIADSEFASEMYKLVLRKDRVKELQSELRNAREAGVWSTDEVSKLVLKETIKITDEIGYSEAILVESLEILAELTVLRGKNASVGRDLHGFDLFYDHRFTTVINLVKFALAPGNYISSTGISRILRSLCALGYKDIEIQRAVQEKIKTSRYSKNSTIEDSIDAANLTLDQFLELPLINKKDFYPKNGLQQFDISESKKFTDYINNLANRAATAEEQTAAAQEAETARSSRQTAFQRVLSRLEQSGVGSPLVQAVQQHLEGRVTTAQAQKQPEFIGDSTIAASPAAAAKSSDSETANAIEEPEGERKSKRGFLFISKAAPKAEPTAEQTSQPNGESVEAVVEEVDYKGEDSISIALRELSDSLKESKAALVHIADAVLRLRDLYNRLGELQKREFVYDNSSLVVDLMELEEKLLELGVISVTDVKKLDKEGKVPNEPRRVGSIIRNIVHELGGSTLLLEQMHLLPSTKVDPMRATVGSEKGMYASHIHEALAALAEYARLEVRDIDIKQTYAVAEVEALVNPNANQEHFIYQREARPIESLRQIFADPLIDLQAASVASARFLKSAVEFEEFLHEYLTSSRVNFLKSPPSSVSAAVHLLATVAQSAEAELYKKLRAKVEQLLKQGSESLTTYVDGEWKSLPDFFRSLFSLPAQDIEMFLAKPAYLLAWVAEALADFDSLTTDQKTTVLHGLALLSQHETSRDWAKKVFESTFRHLSSLSPSPFVELCSNTGNHWIPLPERLQKIQLVYMLAQSLDLPTHSAFQELFHQIQETQEKTSTYEDQRNPIKESIKSTIKGLFGGNIGGLVQHKIGSKHSANFLPVGDVATTLGYRAFIYIEDEKQFGLNAVAINSASCSENRIKEAYFSKVLATPVRVVSLPYTHFLSNPKKLGLKSSDELQHEFTKIYTALLGAPLAASHYTSLGLLVDSIDVKDPRTAVQASLEALKQKPWISVFRILEEFAPCLQAREGQEDRRIHKSVETLTAALQEAVGRQHGPTQPYYLALERLKLALYFFSTSLSDAEADFIAALGRAVGETDEEGIYRKIVVAAQEIDEVSRSAHPHGLSLPMFAGRRQGLDLIHANLEEGAGKLPAIEFFNYELLNSPRLVNYEDWRVRVQANVPMLRQVVDVDSPTQSGAYGPIAAGFVPRNLPTFEFIRPYTHRLYWEAATFELCAEATRPMEHKDEVGLTGEHQNITPEVSLILALERLKYEAKYSKDLEVRMRNISTSRIVQDLVRHCLSDNLWRENDHSLFTIDPREATTVNPLLKGASKRKFANKSRFSSKLQQDLQMTQDELKNRVEQDFGPSRSLDLSTATEVQTRLKQSLQEQESSALNAIFVDYHQSEAAATKEEKPKKQRLSRDAGAYVDYIKRLKNGRSANSKYSQFAQQQKRLHAEVGHWRELIYQKAPKIYQVGCSSPSK